MDFLILLRPFSKEGAELFFEVVSRAYERTSLIVTTNHAQLGFAFKFGLAEEAKKLNDLKEPAIIISASGMCEAGRIRLHLKNNLGDAKNLVLFIGYCAEHTLGAQILAGRSPVNIFGEPHAVRARAD